MVLWERVVQVAGENDPRAVDEDVEPGLVLFLTFLLIEGLLPLGLSLLLVVQINELVLDGFNEVLDILIGKLV